MNQCPEQVSEQSVSDKLARMTQESDVVGLLDWMRQTSPDLWPMDIMGNLAKATRQLAKEDLSQLVDTAFGEIIGFAMIILLRCQLHVENRLAQCDGRNGSRTHLPNDLDKEGWLTRCERISRFIAEISSSRARVLHVQQLHRKGQKKLPRNGLVMPIPSPADADRISASPQHVAGSNGNGQQIRFT